MEKKSQRVLYVDDDEDVIFVQQRLLERFGYDVRAFASPTEALEHFRLSPGQYDIAIIDLIMPALNGDILSREIKKISPDLPIILCTGYGAEMAEDHAHDLDIEGVLVKPVALDLMLKALSRVLDGNV